MPLKAPYNHADGSNCWTKDCSRRGTTNSSPVNINWVQELKDSLSGDARIKQDFIVKANTDGTVKALRIEANPDTSMPLSDFTRLLKKAINPNTNENEEDEIQELVPVNLNPHNYRGKEYEEYEEYDKAYGRGFEDGYTTDVSEQLPESDETPASVGYQDGFVDGRTEAQNDEIEL